MTTDKTRSFMSSWKKTMEPSPDNSPEPFFLKTLTADIPANAVPMMSYGMMMNTGFPMGTAMKK